MGGKQSFGPAYDYMRDAWQRSILFLDVLRQRGNIYREQKAKAAPNVLEFEAEHHSRRAHVATARQLRPGAHRPARGRQDRPSETAVRRRRSARGPRARHRRDEARQRDRRGAEATGHPCYFIGFLPEPMPDRRSRMSGTPRRHSSRRSPGAIPGAGKPGRHRQLPGRLADDDHGGGPSRRRRADPAGRLAVVLLGRRPRQEPDALSRRACSAAPG